MFSVRCPSCRNELCCEDNMRGSTVQCVVCNSSFEIPYNGMIDSSGNVEAGNGKLLSKIAIILSGVAIVIAIGFGVFIHIRSANMTPFNFSSDAEVSAKRIFEKDIKSNAISNSQRGYILSSFASEAIRNYEVEIKERGRYAIAFWTTTVSGKTYKGYDWMMLNRNDVYVSCYISYTDNNLTASEKEWVKSMRSRAHDHAGDGFDWDFKVK